MSTAWRLGLLLLTVLAGVSQFALPALRPAVTGAFLLFGPGAALVGFFRLDAPLSAMLCLALSLALVTLTAEATVLLGLWSLEDNFWFLCASSALGVALQLLRGDTSPSEYGAQ